jgi:hypothetical protein
VHSVRSVSTLDVNKLLKRSLGCFCAACIDENWHNCSNLAWASGWEVEVLRVDDVGFVQATVKDAFTFGLWDDFGTDGEHLVSCLGLGENFAVEAKQESEEGVEFYLLLCCKQAYVVQEEFTYPWEEQFSPGDLAVKGQYYQSGARGHRIMCIGGSLRWPMCTYLM